MLPPGKPAKKTTGKTKKVATRKSDKFARGARLVCARD
jgi:hypothetical protein